jgi:hypothetical protein
MLLNNIMVELAETVGSAWGVAFLVERGDANVREKAIFIRFLRTVNAVLMNECIKEFI